MQVNDKSLNIYAYSFDIEPFKTYPSAPIYWLNPVFVLNNVVINKAKVFFPQA